MPRCRRSRRLFAYHHCVAAFTKIFFFFVCVCVCACVCVAKCISVFGGGGLGCFFFIIIHLFLRLGRPHHIASRHMFFRPLLFLSLLHSIQNTLLPRSFWFLGEGLVLIFFIFLLIPLSIYYCLLIPDF
jgi:hypothetical protein